MASLAAFLIVAVVVIVTPGPDTALTIRNTLLGGRRGGVFTGVGVAAGQATWRAEDPSHGIGDRSGGQPIRHALQPHPGRVTGQSDGRFGPLGHYCFVGHLHRSTYRSTPPR